MAGQSAGAGGLAPGFSKPPSTRTVRRLHPDHPADRPSEIRSHPLLRAARLRLSEMKALRLHP